jgi:predicted anti-sigma-YlaC factor YlaD
MLCEKIQELLKTDYLDGEINQREEQEIKEHLAHCPQCRRLGEELLAQRLLFQKAEQVEPPERVWQNIRDAIITQELNQESRFGTGILGRLKNLFAVRPAFVLASALTVIIFVAFFTGAMIHKRQLLSKQNIPEGSIYLLDNDEGLLLYDLGTGIEEYFL